MAGLKNWDNPNKARSIGQPSIFHFQTCDMLNPNGFSVSYAEFSDGIFIDCSIQDIYLTLCFFGHDSAVKWIVSSDTTAVQRGLPNHNDHEHCCTDSWIVWRPDFILYASPIMAAGQDDATQIIGTEGKFQVNAQPVKNLLTIYKSTGIGARSLKGTTADSRKRLLLRRMSSQQLV